MVMKESLSLEWLEPSKPEDGQDLSPEAKMAISEALGLTMEVVKLSAKEEGLREELDLARKRLCKDNGPSEMEKVAVGETVASFLGKLGKR